MLCPKCNIELDTNGKCPNCGYEQDAQVMSNREVNNYSGVTIEEENNVHKETASSQTYNYNRNTNGGFYTSRNGMNVRYVRLGGSSRRSSWLTKGLFAIGGLAILGFFFFVALPVLLTLVGVGIVAWIIFKFLRKH